MKIGIIDADLIGLSNHRFPNLVCMKLSSYFKSQGNYVTLLLDYDDIDYYDKVFISKVFTKTKIPFENKDETLKTENNIIEFYKDNPILNKPNVEYGGTGFYYDKSPKLEYDIEHIMPDYHLYDDWVNFMIANGKKRNEFEYYLDYSIGFLTRGCFRKCQFCVNKHYDRCSSHSNIYEFYDETRPRLCFLDDNFFACGEWKSIIQEVKSLGKPFQFKQGLDERLLTKDKIDELVTWKYVKSITFAFDNIEDRELIETKMNMLYELYPKFNKPMTFYVFCGFDRNGKYDEEFWKQDIKDTLLRCYILSKYSAFPYVMRHQNCYNAPYPYNQIYTNLAGWSNLPTYFINHSFNEYCIYRGMSSNIRDKYIDNYEQYLLDGGNILKSWKAYNDMIDKVSEEILELTKFIPKQVSQFGNWKNQKKLNMNRKETYNNKLSEIQNINKDKIKYLIDNQVTLTYKQLCNELDITYYCGGTKKQQMDLFETLYDFEKNGKFYIIKEIKK